MQQMPITYADFGPMYVIRIYTFSPNSLLSLRGTLHAAINKLPKPVFQKTVNADLGIHRFNPDFCLLF